MLDVALLFKGKINFSLFTHVGISGAGWGQGGGQGGWGTGGQGAAQSWGGSGGQSGGGGWGGRGY